MSHILLNDYTDNYSQTQVKLAVGGYQATIAQQSGTFSYEGTTFTKSVQRNENGISQISVSGSNVHGVEINSDNYHKFMEAAGLDYISGEWDADILTWCPRDNAIHKYGAGENTQTYPFLTARYSESGLYQEVRFGMYSSSYTGQETVCAMGEQSNIATFGYGAYLALDTRTEAEYGGYVFGLMSFYNNHNNYSGQNVIQLYIYYSESINARIWQLGGLEPDQGEKGFRPVGDRTKPNKPRGGGGRSGQVPPYESGTVETPGEPDESAASAVGSGFINVYKVEPAQLNKIGSILFTPNFNRMLKQLVANPIDCLISLNVFPCSPHIGGTEYIKGFGYNFKFDDDSDSATGHKLSKQFKSFDFGTVVVPEQWESYLDYDATSVTLFLPFIGEVDLPTSEVMGSSVNVTYTVDFLTGMCVANVSITKAVAIGDRSVSNKAVHSYQGNCAINIPLTAVNYGAMVGSFINAANTGLRSGISGGLSSLASDIVSGGFKPTVTTKGTLSANAGFCGVLYPYITINRPIPVECDNYQEVEGYPSYINNTIGSLQGLCVCDAIDLSGITGATASEIARLEQLCKEGVRN